MSAGIILGTMPVPPLRLARGDTRLPIGSTQFLVNMAVVGDTFIIYDVGLYILSVIFRPGGTNGATPYTLVLYDETAGVPLESYDSDASAGPGSDAVFNIPLNVTDPTHYYSLQIIAFRGEASNYAMDLGGRIDIPIFQCTIMPFLSSGGAVGNDIPRYYNYPTPQPALPQLYGVFYKDINNSLWTAGAGDTAWTGIETAG